MERQEASVEVEFMTLGECAAILRVTPRTLRTLAANGRFPRIHRFSANVSRVRRDDFERHLQRIEREATHG